MKAPFGAFGLFSTAKDKHMDKPLKRRLLLFIGLATVVITFTVTAYQYFFTGNFLVEEKDPEQTSLYIPTGGNYQNIIDSLTTHKMVGNMLSFRFVSKLLDLPERVRPGRYVIRQGMGNLAVVRMLRNGDQTPAKVTFNNARTLTDLAPKVARNLEMSPDSLLAAIRDTAMLRELGVRDTAEVKALFIPNTYEVFWNTDPRKLLKRMKKEYETFWNTDRLQKAQALNLSPFQVQVLASIVQAETIKRDEMPRVAGLYMNRLRTDMPLQSDPTVIFAIGDFGIRRVLFHQLQHDSPYNTYKYPGLPPGPINVTDARSIDAVLNMEKHDYLFMCAKEDFSGYHNFAQNLQQHSVFAKKYREALDKRNIKE